MNKKEIIQKVIDSHKKREELLDKFQELFGFSDDGAFYDTIFQLEDLNLKLASQLIGDECEWLEWYIYENKCGENGYEAGYEGNLIPIKSIDNLLELIDNGKVNNDNTKRNI